MSKNSTNDGIANKNFYGKSSQTNLNIPEENDKIDQFKILKLITAISETILAFTMIGGMMVLSLATFTYFISTSYNSFGKDLRIIQTSAKDLSYSLNNYKYTMMDTSFWHDNAYNYSYSSLGRVF